MTTMTKGTRGTVSQDSRAWQLQPNTRVLCLGRVSTREQAGPDKVSLKDQERAVREFADRLVPGAPTEWREDPGVSGLDPDRLEEIVQACEAARRSKSSPSFVVVYDMSRFTRLGTQAAMYYLERLERAGWKLLDTTLKLAGRPEAAMADAIQITVACEVAAELSRMLKRKVPPGMRSGIRLGKWQGGPTPFGYKLGADQHLVPNKDAGTVKKLYTEFATGARVVPLAEKYGLKPSTVRWILDSDVYRGALVWGKNGQEENYEENTKAHEAIVDMETWTKVHDQLRGAGSGRSKHTPHLRDSSRPYALSGLIQCTQGHDLVGGGGVPKSGPYAGKAQQYRQLRCRACGVAVNEWRLELTAGHLLAAYAKKVERVIAREVEKLLKQERGGDRARQLAAERAAIEEQRTRIVGAVSRGVMTEDDARGTLQDLNRRTAAVDAQEKTTPAALKGDLEQVLYYVSNFGPEVWMAATADERRRLFQAFVSRATIAKDGTLTLQAHPPVISFNSERGRHPGP